MATPNLAIAHIAANQTQKEVTANAAFDTLDTAMTDTFLYDASAGGSLTPTAASIIAAFTLKFTGTLPNNATINVPNNKKFYRIHHAASGAFTVTVKVAGQTGVVLNPGDIRLVYCNGTDIVQGDSYAASSEQTAHKDVANGYAGLDGNGFLKAAEANLPRDLRTTTSEAVNDNDRGNVVIFSNGSAVAATIAQANNGGNFLAGWYALLWNQGAGVVTLTPTTSTINGLAAISLAQYTGCFLISDGANYIAVRVGLPAVPAPATSTDVGNAGQIAYDSGFIYVCVAANSWKRAALSTF